MTTNLDHPESNPIDNKYTSVYQLLSQLFTKLCK